MIHDYGEDEVEIRKVKEQLKGRFEMKDLGEAEIFSGFESEDIKGS